MSLSTLLNVPCTIHRRSTSEEDPNVSEESVDTYGNPIPVAVGDSDDDHTYDLETLCWIQQDRRTEPGEAGEMSDAYWTIFLHHGTDVDTSDAVTVEGYGRFEFVGDPWPAVQGSPSVWHVEGTLRRTGPDEVGS